MLIVSNLIERPDDRLSAVILRHYIVEDGQAKVRISPFSTCQLLACISSWALLEPFRLPPAPCHFRWDTVMLVDLGDVT
jgi:hypothetical protein